MFSELARKGVFSIPNLFPYLRVALIPAFVDFSCDEDFDAAFPVLVLSFLSDGADGFIARRFNVIIDLGKAPDPIADKLSQAAIVFCAGKAPIVFVLPGVHPVKELAMFVLTVCLYKQMGHVYGAPVRQMVHGSHMLCFCGVSGMAGYARSSYRGVCGKLQCVCAVLLCGICNALPPYAARL